MKDNNGLIVAHFYRAIKKGVIYHAFFMLLPA